MAEKIYTSKYSKKLMENKSVLLVADKKSSGTVITVDSKRKYQTMLGFGGAFTESAAYTLSKIDKELRDEVIRAYYDTNDGLCYNLGRIHIHSCDFSLGNYTYVKDLDESLDSFSIAHDMKLIIPLIKDSIKRRGSDIKLLASPWSPPAWMKTNNDMNHGGWLLDKYRETWAEYFVRFIKEYRAAGLDIWAVTVQNEPEAVQVWDSCIFSEEQEEEFVRDYLGPALKKAGLFDVKIIIHDHNRDIIVKRAGKILSDPLAAEYIWGTGFHWYVSEDFESVGKVHEMFPDKHLLFTEGCQEGGVHLNDWSVGERYGRNMIGDFNNWCEGYLDWNIVLDETGGPNHVGNFCDAPIICDTVGNKLHYNISYYYIGHFSKFVKPGSKRIYSQCMADDIHTVAFESPDCEKIIIVMNVSDSDRSVEINIDGMYLSENLESHSIATYII
ncbi:MAG: glycoside hydrolase family 30 protein [Clostridia bacterium]|nr:glycoside hydrolase family 30 protein [Clostridia bacterium]MBN2883488.1 glycoside hydrolase family 30 protein [Clostridia bacterium]